MSLLTATDVRAGYGKVDVLFNGHITVEPGELIGIVGPNGAGKSTFLGAIAGSVRPTAGSIEFEGQSIVGRKPEDIVRLGLSLVPEGRAIFSDLTVEENLRLGLTGRRSKAGTEQAMQDVTELFPVLTTHCDHMAGMLSGGQQQQLAIARALVSEPEVASARRTKFGSGAICHPRCLRCTRPHSGNRYRHRGCRAASTSGHGYRGTHPGDARRTCSRHLNARGCPR